MGFPSHGMSCSLWHMSLCLQVLYRLGLQAWLRKQNFFAPFQSAVLIPLTGGSVIRVCTMQITYLDDKRVSLFYAGTVRLKTTVPRVPYLTLPYLRPEQ